MLTSNLNDKGFVIVNQTQHKPVSFVPTTKHQLGRANKKAERWQRALWWRSQRKAEDTNIARRWRGIDKMASETQRAEQLAAHAVAQTLPSKHSPKVHKPVTAKALLSGRLNLPELHQYAKPCPTSVPMY